MSEAGIDKLEEHFDIDNYADEENIKLRHHITQSLKANYAMTKDIDYIESDCGEILIVDILTGRVMEGRRFSDQGLGRPGGCGSCGAGCLRLSACRLRKALL